MIASFLESHFQMQPERSSDENATFLPTGAFGVLAGDGLEKVSAGFIKLFCSLVPKSYIYIRL